MTESFTPAYMHTIGIDFDERVVDIGEERVRLQVGRKKGCPGCVSSPLFQIGGIITTRYDDLVKFLVRAVMAIRMIQVLI